MDIRLRLFQALDLDTVLLCVIPECRVNGLLCQQGAVDLDRGKSVQSFHNGLVGHLQGLLDGLALYQLGRHAAGGNCSAAAEGLELTVLDDAVVVDVQVHTHDVAALCVADGTDAAGVLYLSYITGMLKMIHYFFAVHNRFLLYFYKLFIFLNEVLIER